MEMTTIWTCIWNKILKILKTKFQVFMIYYNSYPENRWKF
jgi:hypothetical protein